MQKKTRSLLEELESLYVDRDRKHIMENRAANVMSSAIRLVEQIEETYTPEESDILIRKLLNAIRLKDPSKFNRSLRKLDANSPNNTTKKKPD
jgi:hypothetical protein